MCVISLGELIVVKSLLAQSVISIKEQLKMFKEYTGKLKAMVGEEKTDFIIRNSVFVVVAGSDDIANTYFDTPFRRKTYDFNAYTDLILNSASSFVQVLINIRTLFVVGILFYYL